AETGELIREWTVHGTPVVDACFSPDGRLIVTGSTRGSVRVWHSESGVEAREYFSGTNLVLGAGSLSLEFSPDGRSLLTAASDNVARLWDLRTGAPVGEPMPLLDKIVCAKFSPDGERVLTGSLARTGALADVHTG